MNSRQEDRLSDLQLEREELLKEEELLIAKLKEVQNSLRNNALFTALWEHMDLEYMSELSDEITERRLAEEQEALARGEYPEVIKSSSGQVKKLKKRPSIWPEEE